MKEDENIQPKKVGRLNCLRSLYPEDFEERVAKID